MKKYILTVLIILALPPLLCAEYLGSWKIGDVVTFTANTHSPTTGAATDADSVPVYRVYENETGAPLLTGSMMLLDSDNTDGFYSEQITLSEASGFEKGKTYTVYIGAAVGGVAGSVAHKFQIEAEVDANLVSINGTSIPGTGTQVALGFQHFFDVATPGKTMNDCGFDPEADIIEGTLSFADAWRLQNAVLFGETTGGGTGTLVYRDLAGTKARVTITVDGNRNRSNVFLDGE